MKKDSKHGPEAVPRLDQGAAPPKLKVLQQNQLLKAPLLDIILSKIYCLEFRNNNFKLNNQHTHIPGGAKKRPELCITIVAHIHYREKFLFADL